MPHDDIVIIAAKRTAQGNLLGTLANLSCPQLGQHAIQAAVSQAQIDSLTIDNVLMGCVLSAGLGQAPARQAARAAGLADHIGATTLNKMCGSGMQAVIMAHDQIKAGSFDVMVAGGMESMSNAPHLIAKTRSGIRLGHSELKDHLFLDGLEDAYEPGKLMGWFAEETAKKFQLSRQAQDEFALTSLARARAAQQNNCFANEISPITIQTGKATIKIEHDENPLTAKPEKIPQLKAVFQKDGTVTAANSSSISDGAAALILTTRSKAESLGCKPLARIVAHASHAQAPAWFTAAPAGAIEKLLCKTQWSTDSIDAFEINEAFAVVTMATVEQLQLAHERVNCFGGACALGHPIGVSGARILVTLLNVLERQGGQRGIAAICIGGGEATAVAIERES